MLLYFLADRKYRNMVALLASIVFYAWGAPLFIFIILGSIVADFVLAKIISKASGMKRKLWLSAALALNIGILGYFKYANFFVDNFNEILAAFGMTGVHWTRIALPVGISFFTFHEMSYVIDVYRGVKPPMKRIADYALYILYFPQLIAGPIIRYNEISDQIINRDKHYNIDFKFSGAIRFIIGLSKKVLVANVLGEQADLIFALPASDLSTGAAWLGVIAYSFQIYFDFSGYSDMAIGLARVMGFVFPENFNNPYVSQNITEFWHRWHMSLSRWMRDYLYIPLGGNRKGVPRMYLNLSLVFLISGFWHGAQWNFVLWGAYHGFFLIADRIFLIRLLNRTGKAGSIVLTFGITLVGWVIFRCNDIAHTAYYLKTMFGFGATGSGLMVNNDLWPSLATAAVFSFITLLPMGIRLQDRVFGNDFRRYNAIVITLVCIVLMILNSSYLAASGFNPFIYFRF